MVVDPVGASLGGASAFKLIYDTCRSVYDACQAMRFYGRDFRLYSLELAALQMTFETLMSNHADDLREPPDLENPDYKFTRAIYHYLVAYQTHLEECHRIMSQALEASQDVTTDTPAETTGPSTVPSPAAQPTRRKRDSILGVIRKASSSSRSKKGGHDGAHANGNGDPADASRDGKANNNTDTRDQRTTSNNQTARPISKQDEESRRTRANASPWTLITWADHRKVDMTVALRKLRTSIDDLTRHMSLRPLSMSGVRRNLGLQQHNSYTPRFDPSVLASIHHSLAVINGDRVRFGVSIAETGKYNHETLKTWLDGGPDRLRPDSLVLFVQKPEQQQGHSRLLAIEAGVPRDGDANRAGSDIIRTVAALGPPEPAGIGSSYALCGAIVNPAGGQPSHHRIFVDRQNWEPDLSLSTHLDNPDFATTRLTTRSLVKIFCHIIVAYLDFHRIRGPCLHPRLEDYLTFKHPKPQDQGENVDHQPTDHESLWWACGFGKPAPHRYPGSSRPPEEERGVALLELGLVLHQLGSGSKQVFETATASAPDGQSERDRWAAQGRALENLKQLSDKHGLPLMHAVKALLLGDDHSEAEEEEIVCASLASLENLNAELRRPKRVVAAE